MINVKIINIIFCLFFVFLKPVFSNQENYIIKKILFKQKNIIDSTNTSGIKYFDTTINMLHINTKKRIIRNELLFKEGVIFKQNLLDESERNLRNLSFIGEVNIKKDTISSDYINLNIHFREKWTANLNSSYKQEGGIKKFWVSFEENNFLGVGQFLRINYNYKNDRNNPHGFEYDIRERRLFGSRFGINLQARRTEDLNINAVSIYRPFFADSSLWASSIFYDDGKVKYIEFERGKKTNQFYIFKNRIKFNYARSYGYSRKYIPSVAYFRIRNLPERSSGYSSTISDNLDLLIFSFTVLNRKYYQEFYLNNFGRVEDVALGYVGSILIGRNINSSFNSNSDYYFRGNWKQSFGINNKYYLNIDFSIAAFISNVSIYEKIISGSILQHYLLPFYQTLVLRIRYDEINHWSAYKKLFLDSITGLRGYNAFELNGQKRFIVNFENRIFPKLNFWIFRIGAVLFMDLGTISNYQPLIGNKFHTSIGLGLRIENSAQRGSGIVRIDLAYNKDNHKFTEVIISSDQFFSAFSDLLFIAPDILTIN